MKKIGIVATNRKTGERSVQYFEATDEIIEEIYMKMSTYSGEDIEKGSPLADLLLATKYTMKLQGWNELPDFRVIAPPNHVEYAEKARNMQS